MPAMPKSLIFDLPCAGDHVLRLHIPVDDAALMRVPQRRENLQRKANRVLLRNAAGLVNQLLSVCPSTYSIAR